MRRTRRSLALAAAVVSLALLPACSAESSGAAGAGQPVSGGSLTWAVETEPITFNPHLYAQAKARLLVWNSFEALLTHDARGGYVPWPATGYAGDGDGRVVEHGPVKAVFDHAGHHYTRTLLDAVPTREVPA